ncbi:Lrp/AsnC family transcriptional regulator [Sphingobium sp. WCS2017Hpa-17]|uniref:Lrp/AsnC family transcriptional regulator n=1 Tax=Sphingobium sp. WCS2017Hpa-17 TaxID=3073638 RepID=UPI002889A731|nr:Lrp/AsnC family transcriptional regulator [Sphingobium sp. WCS2017Hpa-17]
MQIRSGGTSVPAALDALDTNIVDILRLNGRATNQEIAEKLSVTAATVSSRLQKMEEARVMRVVAVTDFSAYNYDLIIALGVRVLGREVTEVASELAALDQVLSVNIMSGEYDMELLVALHDIAEVQSLLYEHIASIEGVLEIDPGIAVDIVKFEFNVAPL